MEIRAFQSGDAAAVSNLIRRTLLEVNQGMDPQWEIDYLYQHYTPEAVAENGARGHSYVLVNEGRILGTGTIAADVPGQCELLALYLAPEAVGCRWGEALMAALERDPLFTAAERVWLTTSVMARGFYERMGYRYVGGTCNRNNPDHLVYMEKYPQGDERTGKA